MKIILAVETVQGGTQVCSPKKVYIVPIKSPK